MRAIRVVSIIPLLNLAMAAGPASSSAAETVDLTKWTAPDLQKVGDDALGKLIKYGHALITDTANQIGPKVADPAKRYTGNNLTCETCHLQGGAQTYAMPLIGVWGRFPQYRGREGQVGTLEDRINGCMQRSMNGRPLPLDSREMKGMLSYMRWLSSGIPVGAKFIGTGTLRIKAPDRAADPQHGKQVFEQTCAACHGANGLGQRADKGNGYQFPPLWGPDSYNNGAGMARLLTLAAFAKSNMPFGTTYQSPMLNDNDAYDVAAYIESQTRPQKANLEKDFPNLLQKPIDAPYGPYADGFSVEQHRFGPFGPIEAKVKELKARAAGQ